MKARCVSRLARAAEGRTGGVTMEYVVLGVLVAAAVVMAVAVFGRAIFSSFVAAGNGASLQEGKAQSGLEMRKADRENDARKAAQYHDSMHE